MLFDQTNQRSNNAGVSIDWKKLLRSEHGGERVSIHGMLQLLARVHELKGRDTALSVLIDSHGTVMFWVGTYYSVSVSAAIAHAEYSLTEIQTPAGSFRLGHHDPVAVRAKVLPLMESAEFVIEGAILLEEARIRNAATAIANRNTTNTSASAPSAASNAAGGNQDEEDDEEDEEESPNLEQTASQAQFANEHATSS